MKYLITGACGALGSALVRQLSVEGKDFRVLVQDGGKFHNLFPNVEAEVVIGSALNLEDVKQAFKGVDIVLHCVNFPRPRFMLTTQAAEVLAQAAGSHLPHIICPGSAGVFGRPVRFPITPYTPFNPPSRTAKLQARADHTMMSAWREKGVAVTIIHMPEFYGPNVNGGLVQPLFDKALSGKDISFPGPINVPHQFIYIDDAAKAMLAVVGREASFGQRYTVGSAETITVEEFCRLIYQAAGTSGEVRGMPFWLVRALGVLKADSAAAAEMAHTFAWDTRMDGSKIRLECRYRPQTEYAEGIWQTLEWLTEKQAA